MNQLQTAIELLPQVKQFVSALEGFIESQEEILGEEQDQIIHSLASEIEVESEPQEEVDEWDIFMQAFLSLDKEEEIVEEVVTKPEFTMELEDLIFHPEPADDVVLSLESLHEEKPSDTSFSDGLQMMFNEPKIEPVCNFPEQIDHKNWTGTTPFTQNWRAAYKKQHQGKKCVSYF